MANNLGVNFTGGLINSNRTRQKNDWYPTPPEVTQSFMDYMNFNNCVIWEPCAGDGAMVDIIKNSGNHVHASDINPQRSDIVSHDMLTGPMSGIIPSETILITNPPFKIADKILEKAFSDGFEKVGLLLKSTYFHASSRTSLFEKYKPSHALPLNWRPDFLKMGSPTMEVTWFYWEKPCSDICSYNILKKPKFEN